MDPNEWARVATLGEESFKATLSAVGYKQPAESQAGRPRARVKLCGSVVGTLTLSASADALAALCPSPCVGDPELLRDWACELTNIVVGRLRTEFARVGLRLDLSPPSALLSRPPQTSVTPPTEHEHTARCGDFEISIKFDTASGVAVEDAAAPTAQVVEIEFF